MECPDISMVPAMAPLDYSSMSRNGSLKRNETAPPKITIMNREVGGKAIFSCPQGFMTEGSPEAVCQMSGQWSAPVPICKGKCKDVLRIFIIKYHCAPEKGKNMGFSHYQRLNARHLHPLKMGL